MNLIQKKYMAILLSSLVGMSACSYLLLASFHKSKESLRTSGKGQSDPTSPVKDPVKKNEYSFQKIGDITFYLNKNNPISKDYKPDDLVKVDLPSLREEQLRKEAMITLKDLFVAAKKEGYSIKLISAYRSFAYQQQLYDHYRKESSIADLNRIDDLPGKSEHQLGLAVDLGDYAEKYLLKSDFANTKLFQWLEKNSYKYGYILRYPKGKESITGYKFHPWSFRYVGKKLALEIYESGLTFDEFVLRK